MQTKTFMLDYRYKPCEPGIKEQVVDMAINGSGIRDTARVLKINKNTVISTLKKVEPFSPGKSQHSTTRPINTDSGMPLIMHRISYWLMFGKRKDERRALLDPFGISRYYTDDWGAYERHLEPISIR